MSIASSYAAHESGFLARRKTSPIGIGGAIAIHVGVVAVVLMMPGMPIGKRVFPRPIATTDVPLDKPPPELKFKLDHLKTAQRPVIDAPTTTLPPPTSTGFPVPGGDQTIITPPSDPGPTQLSPPPAPKPIFVEARVDPRYARNLQPDYPPARLREEEEGKVTVRVRIGTDGRVLSVEELFASNPDFWHATQAQALKAWRFVPATRDGVPVESVQEKTVYFRINN